MIPVLTIRPQPGASRTVKAGADLGLDITAFPLSEVHALEWQAPEPHDVDALLVASANVFAHGGPQLELYRDKPAYAVGPVTARAAQRAGFTVQLAGSEGLQHLLDQITHRPARLLRLAGQRHLPIDPSTDVTIITAEVYGLRDLPMPAAMADLLRQGSLVLLHSAGAAEHFRGECERLWLDLSRIRLAAFGPRIAEAAGAGWGEVRWADQPANGALLDLAAQMCQ